MLASAWAKKDQPLGNKVQGECDVFADSMDYQPDKHQASATGNVRVIYKKQSEPFKMTSHRAEVFFTPKGQAKFIVTTGAVVVESQGKTLKADHCSYNPISQNCICTGSQVTLYDGKNTLVGKTATMDVNRRIYTIQGSTTEQTTTFLDTEKNKELEK